MSVQYLHLSAGYRRCLGSFQARFIVLPGGVTLASIIHVYEDNSIQSSIVRTVRGLLAFSLSFQLPSPHFVSLVSSAGTINPKR